MGSIHLIPRIEDHFAVPGTEVRIAEGPRTGTYGVIRARRGDEQGTCEIEYGIRRDIVVAPFAFLQEIALVEPFFLGFSAEFRMGDLLRAALGDDVFVVPATRRAWNSPESREPGGGMIPIVGLNGAHASLLCNTSPPLRWVTPPPGIGACAKVKRMREESRTPRADAPVRASPIDTGVKKFKEQLERDLQAHYSAVLFDAPPPFRSKSVNLYSLAVSLFRTDPRILAIVDAKAEGKTEQRAGCFFVAAHREPAIVAECIARAEAMIADENAMWPIHVLHHPSRVVDARPIGRRVDYDFVEEEVDVNTGEVVASKVLGQAAPEYALGTFVPTQVDAAADAPLRIQLPRRVRASTDIVKHITSKAL